MRGGVKVYRGSSAAARCYVEADRSRVDDYYLAEGTGIAERLAIDADGHVVALPTMDGETYESWVAGVDPETVNHEVASARTGMRCGSSSSW